MPILFFLHRDLLQLGQKTNGYYPNLFDQDFNGWTGIAFEGKKNIEFLYKAIPGRKSRLFVWLISGLFDRYS
jgi:hypothetical protein